MPRQAPMLVRPSGCRKKHRAKSVEVWGPRLEILRRVEAFKDCEVHVVLRGIARRRCAGPTLGAD